MLDVCSMTVVRNGEDYLEPCILMLVNNVSTVRITVDSRSTDKTWKIALELSLKYPNIDLRKFKVKDPLTDLVAMRNSQLPFAESWGFIVDSDEFHTNVEDYHFSENNQDAYAFRCHAPWPMRGKGHKASAKAVIPRVFKNRGILEWRGKWGKEKLYRGDTDAFKDAYLLPFRYIHFTHLKQDDWRTELRQKRVADDRSLYQLPDDIIKIIHNIHGERENLPAVRGWD